MDIRLQRQAWRHGGRAAEPKVPGVNYFDLSASIILSGAVGR
jgi:hypothetical protein